MDLAAAADGDLTCGHWKPMRTLLNIEKSSLIAKYMVYIGLLYMFKSQWCTKSTSNSTYRSELEAMARKSIPNLTARSMHGGPSQRPWSLEASSHEFQTKTGFLWDFQPETILLGIHQITADLDFGGLSSSLCKVVSTMFATTKSQSIDLNLL